MRLTIFGATGGTGVRTVRRALDAGHDVTAVVRDPADLPSDLRACADVVRADVMDPAAIEEAVKGATPSCPPSAPARAARRRASARTGRAASPPP